MQEKSKGRALLFLVSKFFLNPSYWHIWCIKNHKIQNKIKKVTAPQSIGGQELKKTHFVICKNVFSLQLFFWLILWFCISKMTYKAQKDVFVTFEIIQNGEDN